MLRDIGTIIRKELSEWFGASSKRSRFTLLIFAGMFGVVMPLQSGGEWTTSAVSVFSLSWLPFILVASTIADSVAGERERHTLETLLASRVPDGALFFGKLLASMIYAVGQLWLIALLGAITTNIAFWSGRVTFFPPGMFAGIVFAPVLVAGLAAGTGILVSMRAPTARAAYQSLTIAIFIVALPLFLIGFIPDSARAWLTERTAGVSVSTIVVLAAVALLAVDATLITVARLRFRRGRLEL